MGTVIDPDPHVMVNYDRIPKNEVEIRRSSAVFSTDGHHLGHVEGFLVGSGETADIVLERGHLWARREVVIPAAAVERVQNDSITLKLTKQQVGRARRPALQPLVLGTGRPGQQAALRPAAANCLGGQRRVLEHRQADDAVAGGAAIAQRRYRRCDADPLRRHPRHRPVVAASSRRCRKRSRLSSESCDSAQVVVTTGRASAGTRAKASGSRSTVSRAAAAEGRSPPAPARLRALRPAPADPAAGRRATSGRRPGRSRRPDRGRRRPGRRPRASPARDGPTPTTEATAARATTGRPAIVRCCR